MALVPFYMAAARLSPGRALLCGALWGLAAALGLSWWFAATVSGFFHQSRLVGWTAFLAFSVVSASLYYGVFAAWVSWMARRQAAGPLALAAAWCTTEFARASLLLADPWGLSAYSQVPFGTLMQLADTSGPYGIGLLIGGANACLAAVVEPRLRGLRFRLAAAALALALLASLAYGRWRLAEPPAIASMRVAVVQSGGRTEHEAGTPRSRLLRYLDLTRGVAGQEPALVVWPESALDFYVEDDSAQRRSLLAASDLLQGTELLVGGLGHTPRRGGWQPHNSAFLLRAGRVEGRYHKVLLYPVAERPLFGIGGSALASGDAPAPVASRHGPIAVLICVEAMHPEYARRLGRDAGLLVNLSNDAWFDHPVPAAHQLAITSVRAIENRRWLVRASASGFSALIDPTGHVVSRSTFGQPDTVVGSVAWRSDVTPYQRWGDALAWAALVFVVASTLGAAVRNGHGS
jgi:apolipoprotein N-acyltransferase